TASPQPAPPPAAPPAFPAPSPAPVPTRCACDPANYDNSATRYATTPTDDGFRYCSPTSPPTTPAARHLPPTAPPADNKACAASSTNRSPPSAVIRKPYAKPSPGGAALTPSPANTSTTQFSASPATHRRGNRPRPASPAPPAS